MLHFSFFDIVFVTVRVRLVQEFLSKKRPSETRISGGDLNILALSTICVARMGGWLHWKQTITISVAS